MTGKHDCKLDEYFKKNLTYPISDNKVEEYRLFKDFIKRDWIYVTKHTSDIEIRKFVNKYHCVIAKPNYGAHGYGVSIIHENCNDELMKVAELAKTTDFIIEQMDYNCKELNDINASSLNTIRCYTLAEKTGNYKILEMTLRVGNNGGVVDYWKNGGVAYRFDIKTGICMQPGIDENGNRYLFHPGSNYQMVGFKLPNYDQLLEYVSSLCKVESSAKFVGWDIAITPDGFDLIEMNCPGGHYLLQVFGTPYGDVIEKNINYK